MSTPSNNGVIKDEWGVTYGWSSEDTRVGEGHDWVWFDVEEYGGEKGFLDTSWEQNRPPCAIT